MSPASSPIRTESAPTIRVLAPAVTARIAAGEVVERPASVVKELVENALDAGARRIHIEIAGGGRELVRVSDDGRGMSPADLELCLLSHATSKLQSADDLTALRTLGFRGEALGSIGAVSRLSIVSRRNDAREPGAWRVEMSGGEPERPAVSPAAGPPGTTVEIRELFFNLPARLKFLRGPAAEAAACTDTVLRLALSRPDAGFTLQQARHEIFSVAPGAENAGPQSLSSAAPQLPLAAYYRRAREVLGRSNSQGLLEVAFDGPAVPVAPEEHAASAAGGAPRGLPPGYRIYGLLAPPAISRPNRNAIYLTVNGRPVKDRTLTSALLEAYRHLLPPKRYPIAALWFDLPGADVDINVHPQKSEVRFRLPGLVYALLHHAVRSACGVTALPERPAAPVQPRVPLGAPRPENGQRAFDLWPRVEAIIARRELPVRSDETQGRGDMATRGPAHETSPLEGPRVPVSPRPGVEPASGASIAAEAVAPFGVVAPAPVAVKTAPFRVLGQAGGAYIVLEDDSGVKLIDQHALHERVLFEILLERAHGHARGDAQGLLLPETIELTPVQAAVFAQDESAVELLRNLGFDAESFGPRTIVVRAVPAILKNPGTARLVTEVLDAIAEATESGKAGKAASRSHWREKAVYVLCCKGAIKAGERMSVEQMTALVAEFRRRVQHGGFTCPHGRPLALEVSWAELERAVGR